MDGTCQFFAKNFIDRLVAFYRAHAGELFRHQDQLEVGFRCRAGVHVTFVDQFQMERLAGFGKLLFNAPGDFHDDSRLLFCDNYALS